MVVLPHAGPLKGRGAVVAAVAVPLEPDPGEGGAVGRQQEPAHRGVEMRPGRVWGDLPGHGHGRRHSHLPRGRGDGRADAHPGSLSPGADTAENQSAVPAATAACTARAIRPPHTERGPPYGSGSVSEACGPAGSAHATQTASEDVPVARSPASASACAFASVAVTTALTSAASDSGTGTTTSTLIVPAGSSASWAATSGGTAASTGRPSPTVAATVTPASCACVQRPTSAAVSMATPAYGGRPSPAAMSRACATGPGWKYSLSPCASSHQARGPSPPPTIPDETARQPGPGVQTQTGQVRPLSVRERRRAAGGGIIGRRAVRGGCSRADEGGARGVHPDAGGVHGHMGRRAVVGRERLAGQQVLGAPGGDDPSGGEQQELVGVLG